MLASDTAQASGLAMKVGPCIKTPPSVDIPSATRRLVNVAA